MKQNVAKVVEIAKSEKAHVEGSISRRSEELVIGMVGAIGSGVSTTANLLKEKLEEQFGYKVEIIKLSDIIKNNAAKVSLSAETKTEVDRINKLQAVGTELRKKFGPEYLALKAIETIGVSRKANGGYDETKEIAVPQSRRHVTIIDSIKHPKESLLLRDVYGEIYWQITVFAPDNLRENRLKTNASVKRSDIITVFERDDNDPRGYGQKVAKTAFMSDLFVRNDRENTDTLKAVIDRYLSLIFNLSVGTPTRQELGMLAAVSAANSSACLSRQVGAAIYTKDNSLLSIGWNDAPKFGGGLYSYEDNSNDHRCYKWGKAICHNDAKKTDLYTDITEKLVNASLLESSKVEQVKELLRETALSGLIEYSRAVHAEMEAITSAARKGIGGIVGGTLYTTTYPCHNCARHIVAAGIKEVYFIEPYAKSLATELHSDAIDVQSNDKKVAFLQFEGVGPQAMLRLFQHGNERKKHGEALKTKKTSARPVVEATLDGFSTHEKRVIERISSIEGPSDDAES